MKKQVMSFILGTAIVIASVMNVSALETNAEMESLQETAEITESETKLSAAETIIETKPESEFGTESDSEEETASETEIEPETEQRTEDWLRENYSTEGGVLGEDVSLSVASNGVSGDVLDPDSYLVPLVFPVNYQYAEARRVLTLVNQIRAEYGLQALTWDSDMEDTSCLRAAEIAVYFEHERPNGQPCFSAIQRWTVKILRQGSGQRSKS